MTAELDTIGLHYEWILPSSIRSEETILLFLHEALGSIGQWKSFPEELCERIHLKGIVYERQGHGTSSPFTSERDEYYLHNYALKELPQFIEKIIPDKKVILVGHSDGGSIALLFAHKHPENVVGIVTMAAHLINEPETISGIGPAVKAFEEGKLDGLKKYHTDKTEQLFYAWANTWRSDAFKTWNIENDVGSNRIPGLFIQGEDDQYGTPQQLVLIQTKFPNTGKSILLKECGHHPHLEQKEKVIELINNWISESVSIS